MFLRIFKKLPPTLQTWLGKRIPYKFDPSERIARHIFSPQNINPNTKTLKANFLQFRFNEESGRNELSCNRFEIETFDHCKKIGLANANPNEKRAYYGIACTSVALIVEENGQKIKYTPYPKSELWNYSHCDIYDSNEPIQKGVAASAEVRLQREKFIKKWQSFEDKGEGIAPDTIQPPIEKKAP